MRSLFALSFSIMLGASFAHSANFNDLPPDITRLLFHYLPLRTQLVMSSTAHGYLDLFNEEGRRQHRIFNAENTEQLLFQLAQKPQTLILTSLTLEDGLSQGQLQEIFESILDFGLLLEAIDIQVAISDDQLRLLCQLPKLSQLTIAKGIFDEATQIAVASLKNLKVLNFLAPWPFESALNLLLANEQLEVLHLDGINHPNFPTFSLPKLRSLTLKGFNLPCSLLWDAPSRTPMLKKLVLTHLSPCTILREPIDALIQMDIEELNITGSNVNIDKSCLLPLVKHFSGNVNLHVNNNYLSFDGKKFLPANYNSHIHFNIDQLQDFAPFVLEIFGSAPHDFITMQLKNDDSTLAQILLDELLQTSKPCHELVVSLFGQNELEINRRLLQDQQCTNKQKVALLSSVGRQAELLSFWPKDKSHLMITMNEVVDLEKDLPFLEDQIEIDSLVLNSQQDLRLSVECFNILTKNGSLANLQLRAKTLNIAPELWQAMFEFYRINYEMHEQGHSLNLIRLDEKEGSCNQKRLEIRLSRIDCARALKLLPDEIPFTLQIQEPKDVIDFNSLMGHPQLEYFALIQNDPFIITPAMAEACMKPMKLRSFEILAPKVSGKNKLGAQWHIHKREDNRGCSFYRDTHEGKFQGERVKSIIIKEGRLLDQIPRKGAFRLEIRTNTIDMESLIEVLKNPRLHGLQITAEQLFTLSDEFVIAISEQSHINYININGSFIIAKNAFKHVSGFDHINFRTDEKSGKECLGFYKHKDKHGDPQGLSCVLSAQKSDIPLSIHTIMEIGKIPSLSSLFIRENVKLDLVTSQLFGHNPSLKSLALDVCDCSGLQILSSFRHLQELAILSHLDPDALSKLVGILKTLTIPMINLANMNGKEKMGQDEDITLIGPAFNDELLMKRWEMPAHECRVGDKEDHRMPKINISFINTAVSANGLKQLAQGQGSALSMFKKLGLSSFNDMSLEDLVIIAQSCTNCVQITVPAQISADDVIFLTERFPHIRFMQ